jgi:serine/threonine protein kinase
VYRARQLNPSRFVAIKTLTQDTDKGRRRFEQEARALMKIQHPSVARFHLYERVRDATGVPTDEYLIAMEFVDGIDLSRLVHTYGRVPWPFAAKWAVNVLDGLAVIHQSGFIHRDIKPANVMALGPVPGPNAPTAGSSAKLLDFGAVKQTADDPRASGPRRVFVGTREYAPPEQWGQRVVPASDLYALGATLYFALTGEPPYEVADRDAVAFMKAHTHAPIPDLRASVPDVPKPLSQLVRRMLAKSPDERGTAAELAEEFREFLPESERARPASPPPPRAPQRPPQTPPPAKPPKPKGGAPDTHSVLHPILAALERVYLPRSLRPPAGHEPPTPERVVALLRRPMLLSTLLVLFGLVVFLIWWL